MSKSKESKKADPFDDEVQSLLNELKRRRSDLRKRFSTLAQEKELSPEQFYEHLSTSANFSEKTWNNAEQLRQTLWNEFKSVTKDDKKQRKADYEIAQDTKNRQVKTLGARKKWLPMR